MPIVEIQHEITEAERGRLDVAVQKLTGRSRSEVRGLLDQDCVRLNGEPCGEAGRIVLPGDRLLVRHDPRQRYREKPRERGNSAFQPVFEDEHLIVVDKSAAVLTVATDRGEANTLLNAVQNHFSRTQRGARASIVHRLDRGTSGLLVFGKSPEIARGLQAQFRSKQAEREYVAIVAGKLGRDRGTFTSRLATTKSLQRYSVREGEAGEDAVTHYKVERFVRDCSLVTVWLETGRRNQIRVHFSEAGHPVLGDPRYAAGLAAHPQWKARRLALHAATLGFEHPVNGRRLRFESPWPAEMRHFAGLDTPGNPYIIRSDP